jgi:putative MFS transporter
VVGYATLAEFLPARNRGRWVACMALIANFSSFVSLSVAYFIIPALGWRAMFVLPGLAALGIWLARKSMPESPRWLESVGRMDEADKVLQSIECRGGEDARGAGDEHTRAGATHRAGVRHRAVLAIGVATDHDRHSHQRHRGFTLYGFLQWLPTIFVQQGMTLSSSLQILMVMAIGKTVGAGCRHVPVGLDRAQAEHRRIRVAVRGHRYRSGVRGRPLVHRNQLHARGDTRHRQHRRIHRLRSGAVRDALSAARHRALRRGRRLATSAVQFLVVYLYGLGGLGAIVGMLVVLLIVEAIVIQLFGDETRQVSLEAAAPADIREMRSTGLPSIEPVKS